MGSEGDRGPARGPDGDPPAVELDGVTKRYGETAAVDSVSLRIREGEFFTLVGPSGCGKTTTLRLIAGFETPTAGAVRFVGEDVSGVPPERRDVGVVFQNYALFPHMTVGENIGYGLKFADSPDRQSRDERVAELLELVDLPDAADRDPESLSGGQQQRVAMARALAPSPDLLLLDEPMSALDAQLRERLRVQVRAIQSELGITTVYITHDQEEALAISDRMAVMRAGAPEQTAAPRDVYRRPASQFVAKFIGDNNVFVGRVTKVTEVSADAADDTSVAAVDVGSETLRVALGGAGDALDVAVGDRLTFCVRPEYLRIDGGESRIRATVANAEFLGETTRVTLDWDGRDLVVRTRDPLSGGVVAGFDPEDAHVVRVDTS